MNCSRKRLLAIILTGMVSAPACGPFFPDTVLDLPQAALRVRTSCLLDEMTAIDRSYGRGLSLRPPGLAMVLQSQNLPTGETTQGMNREERERQMLLQAIQPVIQAGMPEEWALHTPFGEETTRMESIELALVLLERKTAPDRIMEIITAFTQWRASLPDVGLDGPWSLRTPEKSDVPPAPDFPEIPYDIAEYWKAARAWRGGDLAKARLSWQAILDLPEKDHRNRSVWAAWMLAKTSPDRESSAPFYRKAVALAESGHRDALGLGPLSMGWLAIGESDPVERLILYFEAACWGNDDMLISLRQQAAPILSEETAMARAAANPLAREIVTALLFMMDHEASEPGSGEISKSDAWLSLLENFPSAKPSTAAAKAAWICYSRADFPAARRWLGQAPPDAGEVLWLKAKLALRDGRLNEAARFFARAAPHYQFENGHVPDPQRMDDLFWYQHGSRRDGMRGQFHTDRAIVHMGRGEFLRAMDFLARASFHDDAAYLAERVLTTDELVSWVKRNRPAIQNDSAAPAILIRPDGMPRWHDRAAQVDPLRYLLARRLAREFRFREAAEFMPQEMLPAFHHYVRLHRASKSRDWPDETKAVILWHLAQMHRHLGMELFGYEGAPDNAQWGGSYPAVDVVGRRLHVHGWKVLWDSEPVVVRSEQPGDAAVPAVTREEVDRITPHLAAKEPRFHYRHHAAEVAWQAAALLPDNDPRTLFILHEAGRWLASRDPQAADRFYQAIIRRCAQMPPWQELVRRRWFLSHPPAASLPELPAELRFTMNGSSPAP